MPLPPAIMPTSSNWLTKARGQPERVAPRARGRDEGRTLVFEFGDGALDSDGLAGLHLADVLGHLAGVVLLDEEGDLAWLL